MTADLPVPDEAVSALVEAFEADTAERLNGLRDHEQHVRAIAAPIVAAELRRLVAEQGGLTRGGDFIIDAVALTERADELEQS